MTSSITARLIELAARRFGRDASALSPSDDLFEALEIDSVQAMDLLTDLEDAFDVEIPDYELQDARTFAALGEVIGRRAS
ncbi:MAG: acyl carrier protein [Deltaproteobacteria bacterium]|nr:MAG: acyl carrier protein [Deltaproteobacteria bacterium]